MVSSSIAIQSQMVRWLWRAGDWGACNGDVPLFIESYQIRQQLFLLHIPCSHQRLIAHPSIPLLSFKVKASACSFHLCSIPSLQQTPQSTQPDSHSAPTNPRVSFSCYFGVSGRIRPKQSVSVQQQPLQNTQLQASLSITHHPLSHLWR